MEIWIPEPARPAPLWIPEPADPVHAEEPSRSRVLPALPILVLIGALATAAVFGGPRLLGYENEKRPAAVATVSPAAAPGSATPILENDRIGLVTVRPGLDDPRAADVAAMFDTYFTGINERDYDAVAGVLDPAGDLDPSAPRELQAFAQGTSTTRDSDIVLRDLAETTAGRLRAEVSFRSEQRTGHGPPQRLDETCTLWQVVYVLSAGDGTYRMLRGKGVSKPC
ncbi:hypothetical protein QLQ12_05605 [Actinoplanes sp. NEAU-A12]|uniref:SnoaL-like domain-containing protein n=1 Tax=Actinoplanes sandaracinus TaxID=3045177 RepID=A0ABT6WED1_9ACTN|nr:hypothetical protein [Actinoplanes sandaracinus]MDI6098077.1 hypothetical protein [Actinoplanes sandaracinus]